MLSLFPQSTGDAGVAQTLAHMVSLTNASILDPAIRDQAAFAISGCPKGSKSCQSYALLSWVNRMVRYVPDPTGIETLHDPRLMAHAIAKQKLVYGDCDDMSMYLAALLKSIGHAPAFRAVGYNGRAWQHVYVMDAGIPLDPTRSPWDVAIGPIQETRVMERGV